MLETLLETNATRTRRVGGTMLSLLLHGAALAGAVALGSVGLVDATSVPVTPRPVYIPLRVTPALAPVSRGPVTDPRVPAPPRQSTVIDWTPTDLPAISAADIPTVIRGDDDLGPGVVVAMRGVVDLAGGLGRPESGVVDALLTDRPPRISGRAPEPPYPVSLRQRGREGRVTVQFVVDTLGRVEHGSLRVAETTDPLFGDAVRAVLPRYRFEPGEAGGRKVRTLVQMPVEFRLSP